MNAGFNLPSCSYVIVLTQDEVKRLLETGHVFAQTSQIPCTTRRAVLNEQGNRFDDLDRKEVYNDLRFNLSAPVADLEADDWSVQFLHIVIEREEN